MSKHWAVMLGLLLLAGFSARADLEVGASVQIHATADFHAPLTPHGVWIDVGPHGRCWRPAHVPVGWRPYCVGHWVWTDAGWYWASDEPWAWACYHYGGWVHDKHAGWVWAPGVEWAPAWVSWRVSAGHIGWAPLPVGRVSVSIASPSLFVFVGTRHFTEPVHFSKVIVNNRAVFKDSKALNNPSREHRSFNGGGPQKVVVNHGPSVAMIERASGKRLKPASIHQVAAKTHGPSAVAHGGKGAPDRGVKTANQPRQPDERGTRVAAREPGQARGGPDRGGGPDPGMSPQRGGGRGGFPGGSGGGGGGGRGGRGRGK